MKKYAIVYHLNKANEHRTIEKRSMDYIGDLNKNEQLSLLGFDTVKEALLSINHNSKGVIASLVEGKIEETTGEIRFRVLSRLDIYKDYPKCTKLKEKYDNQTIQR